MPTPPPSPRARAEKMSKKINENNKNFKLQNPFTCMYLMQLTFMENLNFDIFCKKGYSKLKWL
jgi:hypothetical protein